MESSDQNKHKSRHTVDEEDGCRSEDGNDVIANDMGYQHSSEGVVAQQVSVPWNGWLAGWWNL